ncbi:MAG: GTP-binding protein [Planctomycetaceae bacterium]|nr:MAG: GTP-binding protein [Planctomycetaceae bacterium]
MTSVPHTTALLTTPPGKGGIAVILLAGPAAHEILADIFRPLQSHAKPLPNRLQLGHLLDHTGAVIDETVVAKISDCHIEINIHGGPQVVRSVLRLVEAKGATIADSSLTGETPLPPAHPKWNNPAVGRELLQTLPRARSELVTAVLSQQWSAGISRLARETLNRLQTGEVLCESDRLALLAAADRFETVRRLIDPPEIVLAGPPNAGKSTLANALVGRPVSIVNAMPGTTRDWVREPALLDGVPVWLTDTAGLWDSPDTAGPSHAAIDAQAVRRAQTQIEQADLVIILDQDGQSETRRIANTNTNTKTIRIHAKCDITPPPADGSIAVSAHTGQGLAQLKHAILQSLGLADIDPIPPRAFTARQAELLRTCAQPAATAERLRQLLE